MVYKYINRNKTLIATRSRGSAADDDDMVPCVRGAPAKVIRGNELCFPAARGMSLHMIIFYYANYYTGCDVELYHIYVNGRFRSGTTQSISRFVG